MKTALIALLAAITCGISNAQQRPVKPTSPVVRYHVAYNLEEGIVADVWNLEEKTIAIPSAMGSIGGGGPEPIRTKSWERSRKQVFFPHTPQTMDLEYDAIIYAETKATGKSHRISEIEVAPIHTIVRMLPPPAPPNPTKSATTNPNRGPANPFQKKAKQ